MLVDYAEEICEKYSGIDVQSLIYLAYTLFETIYEQIIFALSLHGWTHIGQK